MKKHQATRRQPKPKKREKKPPTIRILGPDSAHAAAERRLEDALIAMEHERGLTDDASLEAINERISARLEPLYDRFNTIGISAEEKERLIAEIVALHRLGEQEELEARGMTALSAPKRPPNRLMCRAIRMSDNSWLFE